MQQTLPIGYMLEQKYRVIQLLGQGAFGATYLVEHTHFQTRHVIKEYLPDLAVRGEHNTVIPKSASETDNFTWGLKRFFDEAKLLYSLNHPNIVKVTDLFEAHGTAYFVMPYLGDRTFHDWIAKNPQPTEQTLLTIFIPLLEGLKYIHAQGLLHRDIKPENIVIGSDNTPIFIDFGSARHAIGKKSKILTRVLTPHFAPIEQYSQNTEFSVALDLYSLSASMYQAIVGKYPAVATDRVIKDDVVIKLADTSPYSQRYSNCFLKAIDKNLSIYAKDRHQSANDMQNALLGYDGDVLQNTNTSNDDIKAVRHSEEWVAWQEALQLGSIEAYQHYIDIYPVGEFTKKARDIIAKKQADKERELWLHVGKADDIASYQYYLSIYPYGLFAEEAIQEIKRISQQAEQLTSSSGDGYDEPPSSKKTKWYVIGAICVCFVVFIGFRYYGYKETLAAAFWEYQMISDKFTSHYGYAQDTWQYKFLQNPSVLDDETFVLADVIQCESYKDLEALNMDGSYSVVHFSQVDDIKIKGGNSSSLRGQFNVLSSRVDYIKDLIQYDFDGYERQYGGFFNNDFDTENYWVSSRVDDLERSLMNRYLVSVRIVDYHPPELTDQHGFDGGIISASIVAVDTSDKTCYFGYIDAENSDNVSKYSLGYTADVTQVDLVDDLLENLTKEFEKAVMPTKTTSDTAATEAAEVAAAEPATNF